MANELDQFEALETNVVPEVDDDKKAEKKEFAKKLKDAMYETLKENPDYLAVRRSLTNSVRVVNTLGFGDSGNIIVAEGSTKEDRKLQPVASIVGYRIQNVGETPITYQTEEFTQGEDGVWVGQKVTKVIKPGEFANITRKYATILFSRPEFNLKVANGKFIAPRNKKTNDLDALLAGYYFSFNDKDIKVNSDTVKIQIGEQRKNPATGQTKWYVKSEFEKEFGYLNNSGSGKARAKKPTKDLDPQDFAANYLQKLIQEAGL